MTTSLLTCSGDGYLPQKTPSGYILASSVDDGMWASSLSGFIIASIRKCVLPPHWVMFLLSCRLFCWTYVQTCSQSSSYNEYAYLLFWERSCCFYLHLWTFWPAAWGFECFNKLSPKQVPHPIAVLVSCCKLAAASAYSGLCKRVSLCSGFAVCVWMLVAVHGNRCELALVLVLTLLQN